MPRRTLGLDLGPNSIGWALVQADEGGETRLVDLGVRVFPEGVDNFDSAKEVSRNEQRRVARGMRRQVRRRVQRKRALRHALVGAGLLPSDDELQRELDQTDPYELRSRALREKLTPHELGRVFQHLAHRRGFLSNRRDRSDKELKGLLEEINQLQKQIAADGAKTLGDWLYKQSCGFQHIVAGSGETASPVQAPAASASGSESSAKNDEVRRNVRNRHTDREMYQREFDLIWQAQKDFGHAELLTDTLKYGSVGPQNFPCKPRPLPDGSNSLGLHGLHGMIFFQRTMYWPRSVVGQCELEPRKKRCPTADRHAQRFRILQEVNNLRSEDPGIKAELPLSDEQRTLLLAKLGQRAELSFDKLRESLGFLDTVRFNLERGKRSRIKGNTVDMLVSTVLKEDWHRRPESEKDAVVRLLIDPEREERTVLASLVDDFGVAAPSAEKLLGVDFPKGYAGLSLVAIDKLLPHLERGLVYQSASDPEKSALHAAGYLRRDELQRRLFDRLPDPRRTRNSPIADLPNPVVRRALVELRKVVNAILREYGTPDDIHLEMGRDLKTRPAKGTAAYRKYQEQLDDMRRREKDRAEAAAKLRENKIPVTRDSIDRYLLWQEQNQICVYSGQPISFGQLFGGSIEVDHILPRSRSLDDSQANKVVCFRQTPDGLGNHDKGQQTPYEWLAARSEVFDGVCQRARRLDYRKYRRFLLRELELDDFIARQLNDSRYIARLAGEYLRCLFREGHRVLGLKGQLTAELRHQWGLDRVLSELPDSPAWQQQPDLRPGEKNRADHRHHAIDAVVIAMTNRARLQQLAEICKAGGVRAIGVSLDAPWPMFREDVSAAISQVKVSHRVEGKVAGGLHEDTVYGPCQEAGQWVIRKPVENLSPAEIERIRDETIRELVIARLGENGIEAGRGKKPDLKSWKKALTGLKMKSGVPIRKVRILKSEATIRQIRSGARRAFVKPGSTHHVCIFEWLERRKLKRGAVFVSMLEAAERVRLGQPVLRRTHPERPDARFIMSLCRGDLVLANCDGQEKLLSYVTGASTTQQLEFVEHCDARRSNDAWKFKPRPTTLDARKVTVDPIGRLRWAEKKFWSQAAE